MRQPFDSTFYFFRKSEVVRPEDIFLLRLYLYYDQVIKTSQNPLIEGFLLGVQKK